MFLRDLSVFFCHQEIEIAVRTYLVAGGRPNQKDAPQINRLHDALDDGVEDWRLHEGPAMIGKARLSHPAELIRSTVLAAARRSSKTSSAVSGNQFITHDARYNHLAPMTADHGRRTAEKRLSSAVCGLQSAVSLTTPRRPQTARRD